MTRFLLCTGLLLLFSCDSKLYLEDINAIWSLQNIMEDGISVLGEYNYDTCVTFENALGKGISLPSKENPALRHGWELLYQKGESFLQISAENNCCFSGLYKIEIEEKLNIKRLRLMAIDKDLTLFYRENNFSRNQSSVHCKLIVNVDY